MGIQWGDLKIYNETVEAFENRKEERLMPRLGDITFVPTNTNGGSGLLELDQVPDEVKEEVEQIYAGLKQNPNGRMRVGFSTVDELNAYVLQVQSYCQQRPAGAIRFRKSPTRGLPENYMDFRISDVKETAPAVAPVVPAVGTAPVAVPPAKATRTARRSR